MQPKACLFAAYVCSAALLAAQSTGAPQSTGGSSQTTGGSSQSTAGSSQSSSSSSGTSSSTDKGTDIYVRRISAGATLSVVGLSLIGGGSTTTTANPNAATMLTTDMSSTGASSRIGYGLTVQAAITEHFAIAVGGYLRRMGYTSSSNLTTNVTTFVNGVAQTNTTTSSTGDDVRARVIDIPFMLRYYGKDRHTAGARWFIEGGGAWRDALSVRSSSSATDTSGNFTCCTDNTVQPAHRSSRGFLGGAGAQFIDPFGIRVIPEVRYIRWMSPIFSDSTTHTQRNQVEANLTLSF